jgi:DNA-binding IclR family transcriptional regulator
VPLRSLQFRTELPRSTSSRNIQESRISSASIPESFARSLAPHAVLSWARRANAEATDERFKVRLGELQVIIKRTRERGYAETAGEATAGAGALAMTLPSPMGRMPLAVGVGAPLPILRKRKQEMLEGLHEFKSLFATHLLTNPHPGLGESGAGREQPAA